MIRGGGGKSSGYSADLMVCFPSRTHLSLPSKSICSPSHSLSRRKNAPHHRRSFSKLSGSGGVVRQSRGREIEEEPTSPKVTCAGQIKVRPSKCGGGSGGGKNWQSLMAEIEKIHRSKSESKIFGIKKDVMGFLTCLRDFDFRCFGAFPPVDVISDEEEEEEEEDGEEEEEDEDEDESSGTVFSKWLMFLHEKQNDEECVDEKEKAVLDDVETAVPPPNALLLMRCRSAPIKNWLELGEEKKIETEKGNNRECESTREQSGEDEKETMRKKKDLRSLMEEDNNVNLVVMNYDTNYYKLSADIAKETWVVGGIQDPLFRSRSWKKG